MRKIANKKKNNKEKEKNRNKKIRKTVINLIHLCISEKNKTLNLSRLRLKKIPKEIGLCSHIQILHCGYNLLSSLPSEIGKLTDLETLVCYNNNLKKLPSEIGQCKNLQILICSHNRLESLPSEIGSCSKLKEIDCFTNRLTDLPPEIGQCSLLQSLCCDDNRLTFLPPEIGQCSQLKKFDCSENYINVMPREIGNCIQLRHFRCSRNQLTSLPPEIGQCINLFYLNCSSNRLTFLPPEIGQCVNLYSLICFSNQLTELPYQIAYLINLRQMSFNDNPIDYIQPNIRNFLWQIDKGQRVYNDSQNVHNSYIQQSIVESIQRIITIKPEKRNIEEYLIHDPILSESTKRLLFEYIQDKSIHLLLNLTFEDLLIAVIDRIERNEHKEEIKKVLNIEINETQCKCFTGRMSRLINCLNGFDNMVSITISSAEQISNVIIALRNSFSLEEYSVEKHKEKARSALEELGYDQKLIEEYLNYIE